MCVVRIAAFSLSLFVVCSLPDCKQSRVVILWAVICTTHAENLAVCIHTCRRQCERVHTICSMAAAASSPGKLRYRGSFTWPAVMLLASVAFYTLVIGRCCLSRFLTHTPHNSPSVAATKRMLTASPHAGDLVIRYAEHVVSSSSSLSRMHTYELDAHASHRTNENIQTNLSGAFDKST